MRYPDRSERVLIDVVGFNRVSIAAPRACTVVSFKIMAVTSRSRTSINRWLQRVLPLVRVEMEA